MPEVKATHSPPSNPCRLLMSAIIMLLASLNMWPGVTMAKFV